MTDDAFATHDAYDADGDEYVLTTTVFNGRVGVDDEFESR